MTVRSRKGTAKASRGKHAPLDGSTNQKSARPAPKAGKNKRRSSKWNKIWNPRMVQSHNWTRRSAIATKFRSGVLRTWFKLKMKPPLRTRFIENLGMANNAFDTTTSNRNSMRLGIAHLTTLETTLQRTQRMPPLAMTADAKTYRRRDRARYEGSTEMTWLNPK